MLIASIYNLHHALEKNSQNCFSQNFVKYVLNLIIFDMKMAETMKSCNVHSFSTPPNLCQWTTLWNINVPNSCITLSYFPSKCCNDLIKHKTNLNKNYLAEL